MLRASATAMDQEVQQRSVEYLALGGANLVSVKGQVRLRTGPPCGPVVEQDLASYRNAQLPVYGVTRIVVIALAGA